MIRLSARGIVVSKQTGKILLIKCIDMRSDSTRAFTEGFWVTPGGGLENGETFEQGLRREIHEETGITDISIKGCLLSRIAYGSIHSVSENVFYERYYIVETDGETARADYLTDNEKDVVKQYKWWNIDELKQTNEVIFPPHFATYAEKINSFTGCTIDITDPSIAAQRRGWQ